MKNLADYFRGVFNQELDAIRETAINLPLENIDHAIKVISSMSGSLIITGLGKSGLIGGKLAATFSSLGTRAFFLHAAEAMHGDLGVVNRADTILAISHSGETDELLRLCAYAKNNKNLIISITGNSKSTLANISDIAICYRISKEACYMNLAPTSSTAIQLIIGDALAVTSAYAIDFKPEDFSRLHPAGSLGKRLLLKVKDIISDAAPILSPNSTLHDAVIEMTKKRSGLALIVNEDLTLAGVLTDGDLRRALLKYSRKIDDVIVSDICTKSPHQISVNESLDTALRYLRDLEISSLVVKDEKNKPIGSISIHEIERAIGQ